MACSFRTTGHSASQPLSQISSSPAELSFDEKPNCVKDWAVKAKPFSFLKQILNSGYFLWRIESRFKLYEIPSVSFVYY